MSCSYIFWKALYFVVHFLLYFVAYLIPRFFRLLLRFLTCTPCRHSNDYIYRPEDQVRLIHNREVTEVVEEIFGLVDVKESLREDRQFCCETKEEEAALKKKAKERLLYYDAPFFNAHISTIAGVMRPTSTVKYARENTHSWDGCPIALDWLYVKGAPPIRTHHTSNATCSNCATSTWFSSSSSSRGTSSPPPEDHHPFSSSDRVPSSDGNENYNSNSNNNNNNNGSTGSSDPFSEVFNHHISQGNDNLNAATEASDSCRRRSTMSIVKGVVVVLPGLTSDQQTGYIRRCARALHAANYHVCIVNTRGFGGPPANKPFMLNSAYTGDFRTVVRRFFTKDAIIRRFGYALPVFGYGMSNGGATLSKYLGECGRDGAEVILDAAITCCAPNDFVHVVEHMNRGTMQKAIYQPDMCNDVKNYILRHPDLQRLPNVDIDYVFKQGNIHRFSRVIHFDEHIFSKTSGFRSIHQYHLDSSPVLWLPYTPIPTLVLSTFDDPVIGRPVMPHRWREICANNPRLVSAETRWGGHLGFLGGPIDELLNRPDFMMRFVIQRFDAATTYWRKIQENPTLSSGFMPVIPESWENYYSNVSTAFEHRTNLPTPTDVEFPINCPYFSNRTTKRLPKDILYRPYFSTAPPLQDDTPNTVTTDDKSIFTGTVDEEPHVEVVVKEGIEQFNEKARPIHEVLRSAAHMPIMVNCDYYVDPRVYMINTPGRDV